MRAGDRGGRGAGARRAGGAGRAVVGARARRRASAWATWCARWACGGAWREENLALAFPEWSEAERERVLREHYRELGRVTAEYAHLDRLARAPPGEVIVGAWAGSRCCERLRGRGVVLMSGHFSNFELLGACAGRLNPVDFLVRRSRTRASRRSSPASAPAAGVGCISTTEGTRGVYAALAAGRWVAILGDQDARRRGCFVPFLGRPASTAAGPARVSLKSGAPIVMGFLDAAAGRALRPRGARAARGARAGRARTRWSGSPRCTRAVLEARVRARPELWFWLHRRWKTRPPGGGPAGGANGGEGR